MFAPKRIHELYYLSQTKRPLCIHSLSDSVAWTQVQLFISSCYCDLISIVSLNYVLFYRQSQYYVHLIGQQACVAIVSEKYHTAVHLLLLKDRISIQYLNILQPKYLYICCRWSIITIIMLFAFSDSPNNPNYSENNRKNGRFLKAFIPLKINMFQILNPLKVLKIDDVLFNIYRLERMYLSLYNRYVSINVSIVTIYLSLYNRYFTRLVRSFSLSVYFPVIYSTLQNEHNLTIFNSLLYIDIKENNFCILWKIIKPKLTKC